MSHSTPPDLPPMPMMPTSAPEIPPGTPCPRCGYDLAGLSPDGQCPECGGANRNALSPYRLVNASPAFVKRLHLGATLTQIWAAIDIAWILAWEVLFLSTIRLPIPYLYSNLIFFCMQAVGFVAWWLLSSRDLFSPYIAKHDKSRRTFRVLLIANLVSSAVIQLCWFVPVFGYFGTPTAIRVIATLAFVGAFIASIVYIRSLAPRIPNDRFHRRATIILRVSIAAVVLYLCANPTIVISMALFGSGPFFGLWGLVDAVSSVAMFLPYFFLLHLTRRELKNIRARM